MTKVEFLDGSYKDFPATVKTSGDEFLKNVHQELNLLETDYFGISFRDSEDNLCWIDPAKSFKEQGIKIESRQQLRFGVKENQVKIFERSRKILKIEDLKISKKKIGTLKNS